MVNILHSSCIPRKFGVYQNDAKSTIEFGSRLIKL